MERAEESLHRLTERFVALADQLVNSVDLGADLEDAVRDFAKDLALAVQRLSLRDDDLGARTNAAFLVSLAHDLRAPIGALMHQTQLLTADALPQDLKARSLSVLEDNAAELEELLETLADIERVALGEYVVRVETVDLADLVRGVVDEQHGADVELAPVASGIELQIDPVIARRVLRILLRSLGRGRRRWALELSADASEATVRAVRQGDRDRARPDSQPQGVTLDAGLQLAVALVELHRGRVTFTYGDAAPAVEVAFPVLPTGTHPAWDAEGDR